MQSFNARDPASLMGDYVAKVGAKDAAYHLEQFMRLAPELSPDHGRALIVHLELQVERCGESRERILIEGAL